MRKSGSNQTAIAKLSARLDAKFIERAKADTPDADRGVL